MYLLHSLFFARVIDIIKYLRIGSSASFHFFVQVFFIKRKMKIMENLCRLPILLLFFLSFSILCWGAVVNKKWVGVVKITMT